MNVSLAAVCSVNGKITKGKNPDVLGWTSKEDKLIFSSFIKEFPAIVMGSKTYDAIRGHIRPAKQNLRIVLTRNPKRYSKDAIPEILEFTDETPRRILKKLDAKGYKKVLLAGGGIINEIFLRQGLVNELYLTIEPLLFGSGREFVAPSSRNVKLELRSMKKLNKNGTLFLTYKIKNFA